MIWCLVFVISSMKNAPLIIFSVVAGLVVLGFLLAWKAHPIVDFAGRSEWAEQHLGTEGGTYLLYKLIGLLLIFFGLLAITGLYQGFLEGTLGKVFGARQP